jgi:hypothetical protein
MYNATGSIEEIVIGFGVLGAFYLGWLLVGYIANAKH